MPYGLEMLMGDPTLLVLVIAGVVTSSVAVLVAGRSVRRLGSASYQLLELARAGRPDEARILARRGTRDLAPLLAALGGVLEPPSPRPLVRDLLGVALVSIFPILAVVAGWRMQGADDAADRIRGLSASLAALAILLPTSVAAATLIVTFGRRGARKVRGAAVQILSKSVKSAVGSDHADALRRGGHRDPRAV